MSRLPPQGFTLIELMIVVVIIGVLAAIAIPKFSAARERAQIASVTLDLKVLANHQEAYMSKTQAYAASTGDLTDFEPSQGVTVSINDVDLGQGWAATAFHAALPDRPCGIFYGTGSAAAATPATMPGVITCVQ